jgi:hypothetical protein
VGDLKEPKDMKDIAQFPARDSAHLASVSLTCESALLLKELLSKAAFPLTAARHIIPVQDQLDKVIATLSAEHDG